MIKIAPRHPMIFRLALRLGRACYVVTGSEWLGKKLFYPIWSWAMGPGDWYVEGK